MPRAVTVRGRFADPRHIELDEPVDTLAGPVEVVVRAVDEATPASASSDLFGLLAHLGTAPSADEIDEARREMWSGFPRDDV